MNERVICRGSPPTPALALAPLHRRRARTVEVRFAEVAARFEANQNSPAALSFSNSPVGPSSGKHAAHTAVSAPCSTERGADGPPIRVATQPGSMALTSTPVPRSSLARLRVSALSAALEIR